MKTLIKTIAVGALALGLASIGSAQETINIVGSTAFRNFVTEAEVAAASHVGSNLGTGVPDVAYVESGKSFNTTTGASGATHSIVHGYLSNGTTEVFFRNYWTGSLSGVVDLALGTSDNFISTSDTRSAYTGGGTLDSSPTYNSVAPNVTMTDAQASDCAASLAGLNAADASTILSSSMTDAGVTAGAKHTVGLVTFEWVLGNIGSATVPFTNITSQQASALVSNGIEPLSFFTGNTSDSANFVVFIGRNEDSGTRILTFGESQSGGLAGSWNLGQSCEQFMIQQSGTSTGYSGGYPTTNGSTIVQGTGVTGFKPWPQNWPLNTENSLNWHTTGHSGYTGGGDVANVLKCLNPVSTTGWSVSGAPSNFVAGTSTVYIVSCLGCSDAATAITGGGHALSYNGVSYNSGSTANIAAGEYTPWNFEHCYYLTSATGSQVAIGSNKTAADALADQIYSTPTSTLSPTGVKFTDLVINRGFNAGIAPQ
jgi:hypothetical protein